VGRPPGSTAQHTFVNPVIAGDLAHDHGDPFVLRHRDEYFLYHTGSTGSRRGISVYRSTDLVDWEPRGICLAASEDPEAWNWIDIWAPEVVHADGVFYMYVSATTRRRGRPPEPDEEGDGDRLRRAIGVARADSPTGPFTWDQAPLRPDRYNIDGHPFRDTDGSEWLFYSTRNPATSYSDGTPGIGVVAERLDGRDRLVAPAVEVAFPSQRWEGRSDGTWYVNEGPFVVKRRGRYFCLFSGSTYQESGYGVGLAVADDVRGPWTKYPGNPIWVSNPPLLGPGHLALTLAPDGATTYLVYHSYLSEAAAATPVNLFRSAGRKVCLDRLYWAGDRPVLAGPTGAPQPRPPAPVHDEDVACWRAELWVRGEELRIGEVALPVDSPHAHRQLHVTQGWAHCTVSERGAVVATLPGPLPPEFSGDGEVLVTSVTSFAEDEDVHSLPAGRARSWPWGGSGPVELNLAVRGDVLLDVGRQVRELRGATDEFRLEIVLLPRAGDVVTVTALSDAAVTDLCVYAR